MNVIWQCGPPVGLTVSSWGVLIPYTHYFGTSYQIGWVHHIECLTMYAGRLCWRWHDMVISAGVRYGAVVAQHGC